jgi:hypothetical protein
MPPRPHGRTVVKLRVVHTGYLWRPRFLITVINANDRISRVKPVKPRSNLGQPGSSPENLVNEPQWTPWPSLYTPVVNPWSKTRSNPAWPLTSADVVRNFCCVPQNSPKDFKIYLHESCPYCWGTQLSCRMAFQIWRGKLWKTPCKTDFPVFQNVSTFKVGTTFLPNPLRKTLYGLFESCRG